MFVYPFEHTRKSALIPLLCSYPAQDLQAENIMLICVSMLVKKPHGEVRPLPARAEAGLFLDRMGGREELIAPGEGAWEMPPETRVPTVLLLLEGGRKNQASCGSSSQKIGFTGSHQLLWDNFVDKLFLKTNLEKEKELFCCVF